MKLRTYPTSSIASVLYQKNTLRDGGVTRTGGRWGEGTIYTGVYTRMRDALEFEWDIEKAAANLIKHGIDFDDAIEIFNGTVLESRSDRDGEVRFAAVGMMGWLEITVVYTIRNGVYRIISARRASKNEREAYYNA